MRKRFVLLLLLAFGMAGCLKDQFRALEFVSISLDIEQKAGPLEGQVDTIVLYGQASEWKNGEVRQHGFVLSPTLPEPTLENHSAIFAWPRLDPDRPLFRKTLLWDSLPEGAYYIRAFAGYLLAGEERLVYSESSMVHVSPMAAVRGVRLMCKAGQAEVEGVFVNRVLNETFSNYGITCSTEPGALPPLPDNGLRLISRGDPNPFFFSDTLRELESGQTYYLRAAIQQEDGEMLYSNALVFLYENKDTDGDGLKDSCDEDDDGDGVPDSEDPAPQYKFICGRDEDLDGCDDCSGSGFPDPLHDIPDLDGDGICDSADNCRITPNPIQLDTDGDGLGNACDPDDDNDGVIDENDPEPTNPFRCGLDADTDGCDDCSGGVDGFGPLPDANPGADGC